MILPSSQKSSVIKPSQQKMTAVGDPHGGEIPMELSTKGQVDKNDIPMQKQSCREFAEKQTGWVIKKEFQEQGVSGL